MKKVLIVEASAREGFSSAVAQQMQDEIGKSAEVELVRLRDYDIVRCKGCCACLAVGSASCPLRMMMCELFWISWKRQTE